MHAGNQYYYDSAKRREFRMISASSRLLQIIVLPAKLSSASTTWGINPHQKNSFKTLNYSFRLITRALYSFPYDCILSYSTKLSDPREKKYDKKIPVCCTWYDIRYYFGSINVYLSLKPLNL
jgi:hypothetical protein